MRGHGSTSVSMTRRLNARPRNVSRSRGQLLRSLLLSSANMTGAQEALLRRRPSNFRATTRHKSRGFETPWDHKTRRPLATKIGPSLKYESQPCQSLDMMQLIGCWYRGWHYSDVIIGAMASQVTSLTTVHSTAYSSADQRKPQKLRVIGPSEGNPPVTGEFPTLRASKHGKCFHLVTSSWGRHSICISITSYKCHCAWHLSHSIQCLYEDLGRLATKRVSRCAFLISC